MSWVNIKEKPITPVIDLDTDVVVYVPGYAVILLFREYEITFEAVGRCGHASPPFDNLKGGKPYGFSAVGYDRALDADPADL